MGSLGYSWIFLRLRATGGAVRAMSGSFSRLTLYPGVTAIVSSLPLLYFFTSTCLFARSFLVLKCKKAAEKDGSLLTFHFFIHLLCPFTLMTKYQLGEIR